MSLHGNIKFIAENLIFEQEEDLIGKTIRINRKSFRIEQQIHAEISQLCSYDMILNKNSSRKLALKRYGFLDLEFELTKLQMQKCNAPFKILRNEKVIAKNESQNAAWREDSVDMMNFMLEKDIEKIKDNKLYLKIFAQSIGDFKSIYRHLSKPEHRIIKEIRYQKNQTKVDFEIIDACITNLSGIWFNKHFYW